MESIVSLQCDLALQSTVLQNVQASRQENESRSREQHKQSRYTDDMINQIFLAIFQR